MEVVVVESRQLVAVRAAGFVLDALAAAAAGRPRRNPTLGLATGSTPLGLYRELSVAVERGHADFVATQAFALDEYVGLSEGHPQSYREVLRREVCEPLGLPLDHLHVPDGSGPDLAALSRAATAYDKAIRDAGGIDVQILGIGANGHLGFNEPGSALSSRTRVKRLSDRTRADNARFFESPDLVPTHCVTQGLGTILEAGRLVLVATGTRKSTAVAAALEGPLSASCPGSVLQWHSDTVVVLDEAAAAGLRNREYYAEAAAGLPS